MSRRKWGQHFLRDQSIAQRIVEAADLTADQSVIEIGPGNGELTRWYIDRVGPVVMVEIDPELERRLRERWGNLPNLRIVNASAADFDFLSLRLNSPVVLGNLPYNVSKPVINRLVSWGGFDRAVIMVQKEVASRLAAKPGDSEFSAMSVLFQLSAQSEHLFEVEPSAFRPPPKVQSTVIRLRPLKKETSILPDQLASIIKKCFLARRQKLINNLRRGWPNVSTQKFEKIMSESSIVAASRPQEVSVEQYIQISRRLVDLL